MDDLGVPLFHQETSQYWTMGENGISIKYLGFQARGWRKPIHSLLATRFLVQVERGCMEKALKLGATGCSTPMAIDGGLDSQTRSRLRIEAPKISGKNMENPWFPMNKILKPTH